MRHIWLDEAAQLSLCPFNMSWFLRIFFDYSKVVSGSSYTLCPRPGISHFSKEPLFLLVVYRFICLRRICHNFTCEIKKLLLGHSTTVGVWCPNSQSVLVLAPSPKSWKALRPVLTIQSKWERWLGREVRRNKPCLSEINIRWKTDTLVAQGSPEVKASACNVGQQGSIPGSGRSPGEGNGNSLQYSCLENPMEGGACYATVHGVAKSWTRLSDVTFTSLWPKLSKLQTPTRLHTFIWGWPEGGRE